MTTKIVSGNRAFAQPGIDGGIFSAPNPVDNVLIVARTFRVESLLVNRTSSAGDVVTASVSSAGGSVYASIYNTSQSAGAFIQSAGLVPGGSYAWISVGLGG